MSLKQCCATGSLHAGTPTGRIAKVQGLDCYIADAPSGPAPKGIIVIVPDAFGWTFPNNRILADDFAKNGFTVYLPEFMDGFVMPPDIMISFKAMSATGLWNQLYKIGHALYLVRYFMPFMLYCRPAVIGPRVYEWIKALKRNEGKDVPVGTAGFCWGGYFVTVLCSNEIKADDGSQLTTCGFVAHPSFLKYPDDIEKITIPYSCAAAEHDPQMAPENAKQTKEILAAKNKKSGDDVQHEFVMYDGVNHGFAVRADEDALHEAAAGKKAELQAINWFNKWFKAPLPLN